MSNELSTVFYDIETTGLSGRHGDIILTAAFIEPGQSDDQYVVIGNTSPPDDLDVAIEIKEYLKRYDRIIGWNTHGFDLRFINDRLRFHWEPGLVHRGSFDLKEYCKATFPYVGGSQEEWLIAIGAKHQKTPLDVEMNKLLGTGEGSTEEWKILVHHNVEDILGLREIYDYVLGGDR